VWKQDESITIIINVANALMRQIHVSEFLLQTTYIIVLFMYSFETYVNTDTFLSIPIVWFGVSVCVQICVLRGRHFIMGRHFLILLCTYVDIDSIECHTKF